MDKQGRYGIKLSERNAVYQSALAILLMTALPLLAIVYMITILVAGDPIQPVLVISIGISAVCFALAGILIFLKFPMSILKLRRYITDVASGLFPEEVVLVNSSSSDDLSFIESEMKAVIFQLQKRVEEAEKFAKTEQNLREIVVRHQKTLLHAEQQRVMVQSLAAACHHICQPAAILEMRLRLMRKMTFSAEELVQLEECDRNLHAILDILERLKNVSTFRIKPYIQEDGIEIEMLAV